VAEFDEDEFEGLITKDSNPFSQTPQNPEPDLKDLRKRIAKMAGNAKSPCAKFIKALIEGTATDENPAAFTDALKGFDTIASQKGFVYRDSTKMFGFSASTVAGHISAGNAQVILAPRYPNYTNAPGFSETQAVIEALSGLHETLHHAGSNRYFDNYDYAATIARMRGLDTPKFNSVRAASEYWNGALEAACKPR
jgi:hypothetical protein